jgi:hypothetical protein
LRTYRFDELFAAARPPAAFVDRIEAGFEERGYDIWVLEVKETGAFIGFTGLAPMLPDVPGGGADHGSLPGFAAKWGSGFRTRSASVVASWRRELTPSFW